MTIPNKNPIIMMGNIEIVQVAVLSLGEPEQGMKSHGIGLPICQQPWRRFRRIIRTIRKIPNDDIPAPHEVVVVEVALAEEEIVLVGEEKVAVAGEEMVAGEGMVLVVDTGVPVDEQVIKVKNPNISDFD